MTKKKRHRVGRSKYKKDDRVKFTWAGPRYDQKATVEYVRSDGDLIVHFDQDPKDGIVVVKEFEVAPL
jgi:hypothetical protein